MTKQKVENYFSTDIFYASQHHLKKNSENSFQTGLSISLFEEPDIKKKHGKSSRSAPALGNKLANNS
jgi:hypothetical protein